ENGEAGRSTSGGELSPKCLGVNGSRGSPRGICAVAGTAGGVQDARAMSPGPLRRAFATTAPGLEAALEGELRAEGYGRVGRGVAGCGFESDRAGLERACLVLRTAHRVTWTLGDVDAGDGDRLYRAVRGVGRWEGLIPPDKTFAVDATARGN